MNYIKETFFKSEAFDSAKSATFDYAKQEVQARVKTHVMYFDLPEAVLSAVYHRVMDSPKTSPLKEAMWTGMFSFVAGGIVIVLDDDQPPEVQAMREMLVQSIAQMLRAKVFKKSVTKAFVADTFVQSFNRLYVHTLYNKLKAQDEQEKK